MTGPASNRVAGAERYTSTAVLDAEQRLLHAARTRDGRVLATHIVELALLESAANGVTLNPGQTGLVRKLAASGVRVQLALAPAGTGRPPPCAC